MGAFLRALANSGASNIQEALGLPDITSTEMQDAIDTWFADWFARAPSKELGEDPCQRLPYAIVNKLCKATFAEYDSGLHDTETPKLQWMDGVRTACDKVRRLAMQWAMVGGEAFLKPVILQNGGLSWQVIRRDHWSVLGKLPDGQITDGDLRKIGHCRPGVLHAGGAAHGGAGRPPDRPQPAVSVQQRQHAGASGAAAEPGAV